MDVRFEHRVNIKFCVKLGKTATSPVLPLSLSVRFFSVTTTEKKAKRTATWEYRGQAAATMELTGIPKEEFTSCFQDLQKRWQQCIDCRGNYFEGDRKHYLWGWILYFVQTQSQNFTDKGCSISVEVLSMHVIICTCLGDGIHKRETDYTCSVCWGTGENVCRHYVIWRHVFLNNWLFQDIYCMQFRA
jgi:hypothetical protein